MVSVAVCACTYKRPEGLKQLLDGLGAQTFQAAEAEHGAPPRVQVVIADNEGSAEVGQLCVDFERRTGIPLTYVHEPQRGISFSRNACLEHLPPECDFFAFIDDDEVPAPDWLDQLLLAQRRTGVDVVQGPVVPRFEVEPPRWLAEGGFFAVPRRGHAVRIPELQNLQTMDRAVSGNVLVRVAPVREHGLAFDSGFALSGGSDTLFFLKLHALGYRIVYAAHAVVSEHVPAARSTFRYLAKVRFRIGNTSALIDAEMDQASGAKRLLRQLPVGLSDLALGIKRLFKALFARRWQKERFAIGVLRIAHGLGYLAGLLGYRHQHYK